MKRFGEDKMYTLERVGSFGRFVAGASFPIEYIMTTFSSAELSELTFARDIHPEKVDFEILMQRDIDEERVRKEIEPYLNPRMTEAEIRSKAVFFPPLLVAIVPVKGKQMQQYYPDEKGGANQDEGNSLITREWAGLFKINYFANNNPHAYQLSIQNHGETVTRGVDLSPVNLEIRPTKGNDYGARLVVIDGQHRLYALKEVYEKSPEILENLVVPVCLLFSPNSTEYQQSISSQFKVPTVPEVFRHLFVDVNTTMELVGGHFNILLSDDSIGSLICRKFCDQVLRDKGQEGLAVVEWNTKSPKESTIIRRAYSLTSIGVIELALRKSIGEQKSLVKYLLNLAEVESELYPEVSDEMEYPKVDWSQFSLSQKKILEKQVVTYAIPCLEEIFFKSKEFSNAFNIFTNELSSLKKLAESKDAEKLEASQVLNQIIDFIPIKEGKGQDAARTMLRDFQLRISDQRERDVSPMLSYAIFQRAIFDVWASMLDMTRTHGVMPLNVTKGFVVLLDEVLKDHGKFFSVERSYMQHAVFSGSKIKPTEETRKGLANLTLAYLGNSAVAKRVCEPIGISHEALEAFLSKANEEGQNAAGKFIKHYEKQRAKTFIGSYRIDFSITKDDREDLALAEEEKKQHLREVREGKRTNEEVSTSFDKLVDAYVKTDVKLASAELRSHLGYDTDIFGLESDEPDQ